MRNMTPLLDEKRLPSKRSTPLTSYQRELIANSDVDWCAKARSIARRFANQGTYDPVLEDVLYGTAIGALLQSARYYSEERGIPFFPYAVSNMKRSLSQKRRDYVSRKPLAHSLNTFPTEECPLSSSMPSQGECPSDLTMDFEAVTSLLDQDCRTIVACKLRGLTHEEAAREAGYRSKGAASKMLKKIRPLFEEITS
jgi:DNA-directed RNA polymerase specialized sigma24 family protein